MKKELLYLNQDNVYLDQVEVENNKLHFLNIWELYV
jgi:hypothetical protein